MNNGTPFLRIFLAVLAALIVYTVLLAGAFFLFLGTVLSDSGKVSSSTKPALSQGCRAALDNGEGAESLACIFDDPDTISAYQKGK